MTNLVIPLREQMMEAELDPRLLDEGISKNERGRIAVEIASTEIGSKHWPDLQARAEQLLEQANIASYFARKGAISLGFHTPSPFRGRHAKAARSVARPRLDRRLAPAHATTATPEPTTENRRMRFTPAQLELGERARRASIRLKLAQHVEFVAHRRALDAYAEAAVAIGRKSFPADEFENWLNNPDAGREHEPLI